MLRRGKGATREQDDESGSFRQAKSLGLLESIFGATNMEASDWPTDPVQKARIFNTTTRPTLRLKYSLDANPMSHFEGDIDKIVDCLKRFIRQVRASNVHILYALKRFFWALRVLARTVKARAERNRVAAEKFVLWWTEKEEGLREEYYANILSTNYTLHHSVEESLAEFQKTCTPRELKEAVVRTLMYRRRVEYLRKRRLWRREYEAKVVHLEKLKQLYNTIYSRNSVPTEASEDHMKAIRDVRQSVIACALSCPTLVINHKNVSLEQLLNLCSEIQRKRARKNRDKLLDEWDRQRLQEKEERRQAFIKLALKRESERRAQMQEKRLKEQHDAEREEMAQNEATAKKARGRFTTLALRGEEEDANERTNLLQSLSYRRANDGTTFAERRRRTLCLHGAPTEGDVSLFMSSEGGGMESMMGNSLSFSGHHPNDTDVSVTSVTVSPPRRIVSPPRKIVSPKAQRPEVRATAYEHVVATTAELLRRSARTPNPKTTASPLKAAAPQQHHHQHLHQGQSFDGDRSAIITVVDHAPSRAVAPTSMSATQQQQVATASSQQHLDEMAEARRLAEASAAKRHAERKQQEHIEEVKRLVSERPAAPPLPSFFAQRQGVPTTTVPMTESTLHIGSHHLRPRPLDLEVSADGRLVDRRTAETRKHFAVHRFRGGVTRSVATPFGALTHVMRPISRAQGATPVGVTSASLVLSSTPMAQHASFAAVSPRRGAPSPTFMDHSRVLNVAVPATSAGEALSRLKPSFMTHNARHRCEETVRDLLAARRTRAMTPQSTRQATKPLGLAADDDEELDILHLGRVAL